MNNMDNKCSNERAAIIFQWLSGWQTAAAQIRKTGKVDMVAVAKVSTHPDFLLGALDHCAAMMIEIDAALLCDTLSSCQRRQSGKCDMTHTPK